MLPLHRPPSADAPHTMAIPDYFGKERLHGWRRRAYEVIFESDTPAGRAFDVALIVVILLSVGAVMLESMAATRARYGDWLYAAEWAFTLLFTAEYALRLTCVGRPLRYATSFFGVVDLLAVLPTYLSLLVPGAQYLLVIRVLRVVRVFRVLKLAAYLTEAQVLLQALRASRRKIEVFLVTVLSLVVVMGSLMYLVEGEEHGFTSIPRSVYWAVVTLTTVGYGDISPGTALGQFLATVIMIMGYAIIAVPTGIVTVELAHQREAAAPLAPAEAVAAGPPCPGCGHARHDADAAFCKRCGTRLP